MKESVNVVDSVATIHARRLAKRSNSVLAVTTRPIIYVSASE